MAMTVSGGLRASQGSADFEDQALAGQQTTTVRWKSKREMLVSLGALAAVTILWEVLPRVGVIDHRIIPPPSSLWTTTRMMFSDQDFAGAIGQTLLRFALGMALGAGVGLICGFVMGLSRLGRAILSPLIGVLFPIPILTLFPVILAIAGRNYLTYVALVALGPFFTMAISARGAFLNLEPIYLEVARSFGAGRKDVYRKVLLPGTLPVVMGGIRIALGAALIGTVSVEYLLNIPGVGYTLWQAWTDLLLQNAMVATAMITLLAFLMYATIGILERRVTPWATH